MKRFLLLIIFLLIQNPLFSDIFNSKEEERIFEEKLAASYTYANLNCKLKLNNIKQKDLLDKGYQAAEEILIGLNYDPTLLKDEKVIKTSKEIERLIGSNCSNTVFLQSEEILIDLYNLLR